MIISNQTNEVFHIDLGNNDLQDNAEESTHVKIIGYQPKVVIQPERLHFARAQLEVLLARKKFLINFEDPYDPYVWRKVSNLIGWPITNDEGVEGSGYRLIPRHFDLLETENTFFRTEVNTATYTVVGSDYVLGITYTAGPITINLPAAPTGQSRQIFIKDETGTVLPPRPIVLVPNAGETIDGQNSLSLDRNYVSVTIYSVTGIGWFIT